MTRLFRALNQSPEFDAGDPQQLTTGRDECDLPAETDRELSPAAAVDACQRAFETLGWIWLPDRHAADGAAATVGNTTKASRGELR